MLEIGIILPLAIILMAIAWGFAGAILYTLYHLTRYQALPKFLRAF